MELAYIIVGAVFGTVWAAINLVICLVVSFFRMIFFQFLDLFDWLRHPHRMRNEADWREYFYYKDKHKTKNVNQPLTNSSHYEILGVPENASQDEIKKAYRELVKNYHPDVNPAKNAAAMFRMVKNSYDVLSNPKRRQLYNASLNTASPESMDKADDIWEGMKEHQRHSIFYSYTLSPSTIFFNWGMLLESAIIGLFAGLATNIYLGLTTNPCIIVGIIAGVLYQFLFYIKIGVWVVCFGGAAFWAWFGMYIAQEFTQSSVWIWSMTIIVFLFSLAFHVKAKSEVF